MLIKKWLKGMVYSLIVWSKFKWLKSVLFLLKRLIHPLMNLTVAKWVFDYRDAIFWCWGCNLLMFGVSGSNDKVISIKWSHPQHQILFVFISNFSVFSTWIFNILKIHPSRFMLCGVTHRIIYWVENFLFFL